MRIRCPRGTLARLRAVLDDVLQVGHAQAVLLVLERRLRIGLEKSCPAGFWGLVSSILKDIRDLGYCTVQKENAAQIILTTVHSF